MGIHSALAISQSLPWIAREAGIFRRNNIDFELVFMRSSSVVTAAMLGGSAEVGLLGGVGIVRALVQGAQDFVFIGAVKNILTHSIVATPEIKRPEDLRGKRIGVTRIGSNSHYFGVQVIQRVGLDPTRDVIFRQTGGDFAGLAALTNGTVDAMVLLTYGQSAITQGFQYVIYGPDFRIPYAAAVFVTRRSVMARRPQVIGQFMRAMAEAAKIVHTDREFTYKILSKYLRLNDRKILEDSFNTEIKSLEPRLDIKPEAVQATLEEISPIEPRAKNIQPEQLIDRRYLEEMEKSGFFERLWESKR